MITTWALPVAQGAHPYSLPVLLPLFNLGNISAYNPKLTRVQSQMYFPI